MTDKNFKSSETLTTAFIINYNRLTLPRQMADHLAAHPKIRVVIIDNNSDYEPLLEYYETCEHEVCRLDLNFGSAAPFHEVAAVQEKYGVTGRFIVSDPDLDIRHIPSDWLEVLHEGLDRHDFACKAGFSLRISDLPNTAVGLKARQHEASYWINKLDDRYYSAYIDTTFCLLRRNYHDFPSVRTAPPYDAIHVPWYYTSLKDVPEDEKYYMESTKARGSTFWTDKIRGMLVD